MYVSVYIKDGDVASCVSSNAPFSQSVIIDGYDEVVYGVIDGITPSGSLFESISCTDGIVHCSIGDFNETSRDESPLSMWRNSCIVSKYQAKAAMSNAGILEDAEAAVNTVGGLVKLAWTETTEWRRNSAEIIQLADVLGLSANDLDALFKSAEAL